MARLPFARGVQVFQSRNILRCLYVGPQMRSGDKVGPPLVDSWWRRLSRTFWTGPSACSWNAIPGHARDDWCAMVFQLICAFCGSSCPNYSIGQSGCAICESTFAVTGAPREGLAPCSSLMHVQTCNIHYTCKGEAMVCAIAFLFITRQSRRCFRPLTSTRKLFFVFF